MKQTFGQFLKTKRLALDLSLREFARRIGMQPSNYCNIESDVLPPPPPEAVEPGLTVTVNVRVTVLFRA